MNNDAEIIVTELKPNDLPALRELYSEVRQATFTWVDTSHYQLSSFDNDTKDEYLLVAYMKEKVAGFISVYMPENFIHHLYVNNLCQGRGVGSLLLKTVLEKLRRPVRLKCLEKNKRAMVFYERNGFIQKERGVSEEGVFIVFEYE